MHLKHPNALKEAFSSYQCAERAERGGELLDKKDKLRTSCKKRKFEATPV